MRGGGGLMHHPWAMVTMVMTTAQQEDSAHALMLQWVGAGEGFHVGYPPQSGHRDAGNWGSHPPPYPSYYHCHHPPLFFHQCPFDPQIWIMIHKFDSLGDDGVHHLFQNGENHQLNQGGDNCWGREDENRQGRRCCCCSLHCYNSPCCSWMF